MIKICKTCGKERNMMSWETECYSCRKERNRKEIQQQIESGEITEVDCEDEIYCPHCGFVHEADCDDDRLYIEGECEFICHGCGRNLGCRLRAGEEKCYILKAIARTGV